MSDNTSDLDAALLQDDDSFTGGTQEPKDEPIEPQKEEPADPEPSETENESPVEPEEPKDSEDDPEVEPEEKPKDDDDPQIDERKKHNDEMARQRIADRNQRKLQQEALQAINQQYSPTTQEQLVEQGYSEEDAKYMALREEMEFKDQSNQIANLNASVKQDIRDVERDFEVFNPESESYDKDFAEKVTKQWVKASRFRTDANGLILNAEELPYDFFKDAAEMYGHVQVRSSQNGQAEGKAAALRMVAKADSPSGASQSKTPSNDPVLDELMRD